MTLARKWRRARRDKAANRGVRFEAVDPADQDAVRAALRGPADRQRAVLVRLIPNRLCDNPADHASHHWDDGAWYCAGRKP